MRTISVADVVNEFKKYLEDDSFILEIERDRKCKYYYTDNYNGIMSVEWFIRHDRNKYIELEAVKVDKQEYEGLKREDLEYRYNEILKCKENGLFIKDLVFLKLYENYRNYENGECDLNSEIDVVDGIIGCDRDGESYYVNDMNKLFKDCVNAMYDGFGTRDEGRPPINFPLFPDDIIDYYFVVDEWGFSGGYSKIKKKKKMDYKAMVYAADEYLDSFIYSLDYPKFVMQKSNKHTPVKLVTDCNVFNKLESSEVYQFIDFNKYKKSEELADAILHNFFFDVRSKVLKALIKNREDKDFMNKYMELSLDDFRMNEDMTLEIVAHKEFYEECGIEIDKTRKETVYEAEKINER